jgi:hypothetical protein
MERFSNSGGGNVWAQQLSKLVAAKGGRKADRVQTLKQNVEQMSNLVRAVLSRVGVEKTRKDVTAARM